MLLGLLLHRPQSTTLGFMLRLEYLEYEVGRDDVWERTVTGQSSDHVAAFVVLLRRDGQRVVVHRATMGDGEMATEFVDLDDVATQRVVAALLENMARARLAVTDGPGGEGGVDLLSNLWWIHKAFTPVPFERAGRGTSDTVEPL